MEAALDEFAEYGYNKASVTRIVNKAEIAKGSFYQYFEDKKDLFIYLIREAKEEKLQYIEEELKEGKSLEFFERWRRLNIAGLKFAKDNFKLAKVASDIFNLKDTEIFNLLKEESKDLGLEMFEQLLKEGIKRGEIRKDINVKYTANFLYNASYFISDYFFENQDIKNLDEFIPLVDRIINIIADGIKKKEGQ